MFRRWPMHTWSPILNLKGFGSRLVSWSWVNPCSIANSFHQFWSLKREPYRLLYGKLHCIFDKVLQLIKKTVRLYIGITYLSWFWSLARHNLPWFLYSEYIVFNLLVFYKCIGDRNSLPLSERSLVGWRSQPSLRTSWNAAVTLWPF